MLQLRDALVFKQVNDVVVVDSDGSDVLKHLMRLWVERPDSVGTDGAVVGYRSRGRLRHGVDRTVGNEVDDIPGVVIRQVLDTGRRPQWPLRLCAGREQCAPALSGENPLVVFV